MWVTYLSQRRSNDTVLRCQVEFIDRTRAQSDSETSSSEDSLHQRTMLCQQRHTRLLLSRISGSCNLAPVSEPSRGEIHASGDLKDFRQPARFNNPETSRFLINAGRLLK